MIPYTKHTIGDRDKEAVARAMENALTQGDQVKRFEEEIAAYCGAKYAVACTNGTDALWLAYNAVGLMPWWTVAVPAITFVATANMAAMHSASVEFVDVGDDGNMTADSQLDCQVVAPVHMTGKSCNMNAINNAYGSHAIIIEDAAHAFGASYDRHKVGSCRHSDACCFSFHPSKSITTAEGGCVTTNDDDIYDNLIMARNHGFEPYSHTQVALGRNCRMNELQAALGREQLKRVDMFIEQRQEIARYYLSKLGNVEGLKLPRISEDDAVHLFVVQTDRRAELMAALNKRGVTTQIHYGAMHRQPYWEDGQSLPGAEAWADRCLSLPCYPTLTQAEQDKTIEIIKEALG